MSTHPRVAREALGRPTPAGGGGRRTAAVLAAAAVVLAAGCRSATGPGGEGPPPRIGELPRSLTAAEQEVVAASNDFGFRLLAEMDPGAAGSGEEGGNLFLSPLSASMALGMVMNGASGETLAGFRDALGLTGLDEDAANRAYRGLLDLLRELDGGVDLRVGNSVWLQDGYPIRADFVARVEDPFDAEVANVDFRGAPAAAADRINAWVEEATGGEIRRLVAPAAAGDLIALLASAVYFQGDWRHPFDPERTREGPFALPDGDTVRARLMHRGRLEARYGATEDFVAADLPYGGGAFSMTVVLPPEGVAVDSLAESLDADGWERIVASLEEGVRDVTLPTFEMRHDTLLNEALRAMGMEAAFDRSRADFSRLSDRALEDELHVQWVRQKSYVAVDEEGTTAAAATGVGVGPTSAPPAFRADRPFLLAIRERLSGTILFLGKVVDPRTTADDG